MRDAREQKVEENLMFIKRQTPPIKNPQVTAIIRTSRVTTRLQHRKKRSKK